MWGEQGGGKGKAPVDPPNMLWLIQRDFLEGKTVQQMVSEALARVPNPSNDPDIGQVCRTNTACARSTKQPAVRKKCHVLPILIRKESSS